MKLLEQGTIEEPLNNQTSILNFEQLEASNPEASVWVSASAGTGKTKILTDRVLRLLLNGVKPEKILCITFTKAAAGEMNNRINKELSVWANLSPIKLEERLRSSFGKSPTKDQLILAHQLFHEKLSSVENLKIQTIHSFCQFILGRFPLEAGISPGFKVIDEYKTEELVKSIRINLIMQACDKPGSELGSSLEFTASHIHENTLFDVIRKVIEDREKFKNLFESFNSAESYEAHLRREFSLRAYEFEQDIIKQMYEEIKSLNINYNLADYDQEVFAKEIAVLSQYQAFLTQPILTQIAEFEDFCLIFLTQTGSPRKSLFNKKFRNHFPEIDEAFSNIMQIVTGAYEKIKSLKLIFFSKHLFTLAEFIIKDYEEYKLHHAYLDFDDLIYFTKKLLTNSEAKDWVLYKLDGFVEHILVDEAQDTNAEQWQIIESLAKEFYSGATADESNRTLFVVGDEKQSIYSFQGADPTSFIAMNGYFKNKMLEASKQFLNIDLSWSYRSLEAINIAVAKIFHKLQYTNKELFSGQDLNMQCFRQGGGGRVEIWPLVISQKQDLNVTWPIPSKQEEDYTTDLMLAKIIAEYVKLQIDSNKYILSRKRTINASDFIILVKQRDSFSQNVIKELNRLKVNVAGIDRMNLIDNLAVKDLISLAKFVLLPEDDLNLACLLKSPFIGISEQQLYELAVDRGKVSLWQTLNKHHHNYSNILEKLNQFTQIYIKYSISEFFNLIVDALGYREKLLMECGLDSEEIINEFLELVTNFEIENGSNLQEFINWIENSNIEIKRDLEHGDSLRLMTVHGSKGLQAPIVIMADTTRLSSLREKFLWTENGQLLWPGYAANENKYYKSVQETYKQKDYLEYLRLLYVAMTRAEDELIIFGSSEKEEVNENCWYNIIKTGLSEAMVTSPIPSNLLDYFPCSTEYLVFDLYSPKKAVSEPTLHTKEQKFRPLIDISPKFQAPIIEPIELTLSPLQSRFATEYGTIVHKMLEIFFSTRDASRLINHPLLENLPAHQANSISDRVQKLALIHKVKNLFTYDLKCEVTIGMSENNNSLLGRLDLLAVNERDVIIIDYKTDSKVPNSPFETSFEYKEQLKHYKKLVSKLYPNKNIKTQIFWFENLSFMEFNDQEL